MIFTFCPGLHVRSWVSLKFAVTHKSSSGTIAIICWPTIHVLTRIDVLLADDAVDRRHDGRVLTDSNSA